MNKMNALMMQGGETKEATSVYEKGMEVMYKSPNGPVTAKILDVHFDDLLEPYYTILSEDGVEKQTDNDHLTPIEKRKKSGLCLSCGIVQTHKPGLWKSRIPKVRAFAHSLFYRAE